MDDPKDLFTTAQPKHWNLCFVERSSTWWVNRFVPGRFKHVRAFGFLPLDGLWVFYDVTLTGTAIMVAQDGTPLCTALISAWIEGAAVMRVEKRPVASLKPLGWWCVAAIKHLVGVRSGALRPDALWRDCLRQGGKPLDDAQTAVPIDSAAHDRSAIGGDRTAGEGRPVRGDQAA